LILQGERDTFGNVEEVPSYPLSSNIKLHWLPDGDHSFKPRKSSGHTEQENWLTAVNSIAEFMS
jgi:predicted alpha/beta-hydrolase family hydrolase